MSKVLLNFFQKIVRVWGETPRFFYILLTARRMISINKFMKVKNLIYPPFSFGRVFTKNLYDIRLAIDAIRVPKPPIFTPINKPFQLSVNPDKSSAEGTLLKI